MALETKTSEIGGTGFGSIKLGRLGWSLVSLVALLALWQFAALFVEPRHLPCLLYTSDAADDYFWV